MSKWYIEANRGFVTASKLKTFIKSPEAYFRQYVLEQPLEEKDSKSLLIGSAFDYALSYGLEAFYQKYWIDAGLTVAEMIKELWERGVLVESKENKESLQRKLYGDMSEKTRLTADDGEKVLKMLLEAKRQPLWDLESEYEVQKEVTAVYKGTLKLKGTFDRYSLEKKVIRDYKTTADLSRFETELAWRFGYEISMAFYYALAKIQLDTECDVVLDVVQNCWNHPSHVFGYPKERLDLILGSTIIPALDALHTMMTDWEENKNESIWMMTVSERKELFNLDAYPILETAKQQEITYILF